MTTFGCDPTHPGFTKPTDETIPIWRYMDFAKYVSLLNTGGLYFARADYLGDPFEGSIPVATQRFRENLAQGIPNPEGYLRSMTSMTRMSVRNTVINSWHMNAHESAAMWRQYASDGKGIAIQSRYNRLVSCFPPYKGMGIGKEGDVPAPPTHRAIYIGVVRYIDYDNAFIPEVFPYWPFVHKRTSFDYERELRALVHTFPIKGTGWDIEGNLYPDGGVMIPANLRTLVEAVYIAPEAPHWVREVVDAVSKKYGYEFEVKQSILSREPVF